MNVDSIPQIAGMLCAVVAGHLHTKAMERTPSGALAAAAHAVASASGIGVIALITAGGALITRQTDLAMLLATALGSLALYPAVVIVSRPRERRQ